MGPACGQFRPEQLDVVIQAVEVPRSNWWTRIAAGLLLAMGFTKDAGAQHIDNSSPVTQQASQERRSPDSVTHQKLADDGYEIYGTLKDEKGDPIINAGVELSEQGIICGTTYTDFDGNYSIVALKPGRYEVKFSFLNREKIITDVNIGERKTKVCAALAQGNVLGLIEIRHIKYQRPILETPGKKTHRAGDNLPPGY